MNARNVVKTDLATEISSSNAVPEDPEDAKMEYISTGIQGLDELLNGQGIACPEGRGSLGLILGAAGSGKSILALEMCCRFAEGEREKTNRKRLGKAQQRYAVYLSREPYGVVSARIIKGFNRFHSGTSHTPGLVDEVGLLEPGKVFIGHLGYGYEDQEGLLHNVFDRARQSAAKKDRPDVLICIDSANIVREGAMARGLHSRKEGEAETDTLSRERVLDAHNAEFFLRLHDSIARQGVHTFLVFEERGEGDALISTRADVYAADIAIQLGVRNYPIQYRERVLEIIKAKNQYYHRGQHHFSIVGQPDKEGGSGGRPGETERGIVIYPSVATQLSRLARQTDSNSVGEEADEKTAFTLGISDLDDKIQQEIGAGTEGGKNAGYIESGTNSVLVSDLDIKATEIALHFAMGSRDSSNGALYISFMHKVKDLERIAGRFYTDEERRKKLNLDLHKNKPNQCTLYYLPPEHISEHKLLRDIDGLINQFRGKGKTKGKHPPRFAVVLDNVFELQCKYPMLGDMKYFLTALFELFRIRGVTSLVVDTVEAGESRNPLEQSFVAGLADNVFLLRHVEFRSRPHRVFSVLKLVGQGTPDILWDLDEESEKVGDETTHKLMARDTFVLCKNVLSGKPEPINIRLTLYRDEKKSPFDQYLTTRKDLLRQSFGENVKIELYGAEAHAKVQSLLTLPGAPQYVDCQIVAVDEFWLYKLIGEHRLEDLASYFPQKGDPNWDDWDWSQYVSAAHDIALFNNKPYDDNDTKVKDEVKRAWFGRRFAVPARNNCGLLCFQPALVREVFSESRYKGVVETLTGSSKTPSLTWVTLLKLKNEYERILKRKSLRGKYPKVFFTFCMDQIESCVSFLLESILGTAKTANDILETRGSEKSLRTIRIRDKLVEGLRRVFMLLGKEDIALLSQGRFRTSEEEPCALFCRQWMSTLGCLKEIGKKEYRSYFRSLEPFELPTGESGWPWPVSGTWYLGIVKGSIAVKTGVELIKQFTSVTDEVYKLDHCIGMPVRKRFYESETAFRLPYAGIYSDIAKVQDKFLKNPVNQKICDRYTEKVHSGNTIFYRMLINDYPYVSAVLWRLLVNTAKEYLAFGGNLEETKYKELIHAAANEMKALRGKSESS